MNGVIVHSYIENKTANLYQYGVIYINHNFSKVTISVFDIKEKENKGCSSDNGQMIQYPHQIEKKLLVSQMN
ncbi:hypothetical protein UB51_10395 [Paenibacillus sp. IHBB 10380]|nr:hypothetical protein UB51_10395 [Paenibacillus sp. IHBB 10380]